MQRPGQSHKSPMKLSSLPFFRVQPQSSKAHIIPKSIGESHSNVTLTIGTQTTCNSLKPLRITGFSPLFSSVSTTRSFHGRQRPLNLSVFLSDGSAIITLSPKLSFVASIRDRFHSRIALSLSSGAVMRTAI